MKDPILKIVVTPLVTILFFAIILVLIGAGTKKVQSKKIIDTQVVTCNTSGLAKTYIGVMAKKGYQVQHIVSQNVATSIEKDYYFYNGGGIHGNYFRDLRGDFVIIFTKEIEVK